MYGHIPAKNSLKAQKKEIKNRLKRGNASLWSLFCLSFVSLWSLFDMKRVQLKYGKVEHKIAGIFSVIKTTNSAGPYS